MGGAFADEVVQEVMQNPSQVSVGVETNTSEQVEQKEAVVEKNVEVAPVKNADSTNLFDGKVKPKKGLYTDTISQYDATMNEANSQALLFDKNNSFSLSKDANNDDKILISQFYEALERYTQGNVFVAYNGFSNLIKSNNLNDCYYMMLAYQMADIGFFSLADEALSKVKNIDVWNPYITMIKKTCFPKYKHSESDEMFLAGAYSSIEYNNLTQESVKDILKREKLARRSDFANYLIANAAYSDKDYERALSAINKAISINSDNIYYQKYKVRILCELKQYKDAMKIVKNLQEKNIPLPESKIEIEKLANYVLANSEKKENIAKYHLALYFYLNNDYSRAIQTFTSIPKSKNPQISSVLGDIYFQTKDFAKATEYYEKAISINKHFSHAYNGLGNIAFLQKNYAVAKTNYEKAVKYDNKNLDSLVALSVIALKEDNQKLAKSYCDKAITVDSNNFKPYYVYAKLKSQKSLNYLTKASILNPFFANTWLDLADNALMNKNIDMAKNYIDSVNFLEENNYRYYYYKGVLAKIKNNEETANKNFVKASTLYSAKTGNQVDIPIANTKEF
ncbi:MAG: tetratricopeptide repeat protein [Candidatus Gastranaerophilales bacterium]|nr:tetratricopeptide repeat protein [Candidatus Gastranaerophilales bacterium]